MRSTSLHVSTLCASHPPVAGVGTPASRIVVSTLGATSGVGILGTVILVLVVDSCYALPQG